MATAVLMPKLGLTMEEGKIVHWLKSPGSEIARGDVVVEIETDKATAQIEAETSGILGAILFDEGATVPVGRVIAYLVAPGEEAPKAEASAAAQAPSDSVAVDRPKQIISEPLQERRGVAASPRARRLAGELHVDLSKVIGSGPGGRIVEDDVRRAAQSPPPTTSAAAGGRISYGPVTPLEGVRKIAAERMVRSFTTAPHFYLSVEVDATSLLQLREDRLAEVEGKTGVRLSVSDVLVKIAAQGLQEYPEVNATWADGGIRRVDPINVGLAVATDHGLVAPVFHEANRKSLHEVAAMRQALTEKARTGTLSFQDVDGGAFTISNLGMYAVDQFNAIINPPQAAILAVGRIKERPFVAGGQLTVRSTVFLTLSVDHRILDGADAARFLGRLVALIEEPRLVATL